MATRKIETAIGLTGEKDFNDQMKSVNNNLKNLSAELKLTSESFDDESSAVARLTSRQKLLDEQVEQQAEKVRALAHQYEESAKANGENAAMTDKYRRELASAQEALKKMEDAQKDNNKALQLAKLPLNQLGDALDRAKKKIEDFKDQHAAMVSVLGTTGKVAGAAATGTVKAIGGITAAGAAALGALTALSATGVKKLADMAIEAAENGDPAFAGLASNLEALSAASGSAKAALGSVLLPALESLSGDGAKWLSDFSKAMEATSGDTKAMGKVMSDYIKSGVAIIRKDLPQFIQLGGDLLGGLGEGIIENLPELLESADEIINMLLDGLEDNADELGEAAVTIVMSLVEFLIAQAPDMMNAGITLLTTLVSGLGSSMPELITSATDMVLTLLDALITNAPMLIGAGLELILGIVQGIAESIPELVAQVPVLIQELADAFSESIEKLKNIGSQIVDSIWDGIKGAWGNVKSWFTNAMSALRSEAEDSLPGAATGINYVPYDDYAVRLHEGEMVVPKPLATQLRAVGIRKDSDLSGGIGGGNVVNTNVYTATLSDAQVDYLVGQINLKLGEAM